MYYLRWLATGLYLLVTFLDAAGETPMGKDFVLAQCLDGAGMAGGNECRYDGPRGLRLGGTHPQSPLGSTWRITPLANWLKALVSKSP